MRRPQKNTACPRLGSASAFASQTNRFPFGRWKYVLPLTKRTGPISSELFRCTSDTRHRLAAGILRLGFLL